MKIAPAVPSDINESVACLATAFAQDPITSFMLQAGPGYRDRVTQFFSLLMRARIAIKMPVLVARDSAGIHGAAMGNATVRSRWPTELEEEWDRLEKSIQGMGERVRIYEEIAAKYKPKVPHYYFGVLGVDPAFHGRGLGKQILNAFCECSASDPLSNGVYLETAVPSNVGFYERAGFVVTGRESLGDATLWCMYRPHASRVGS